MRQPLPLSLQLARAAILLYDVTYPMYMSVSLREEHRLRVCREKIQLDATQWFIELTVRSTCLGHHYAHHQEPETIQVITAHGT